MAKARMVHGKTLDNALAKLETMQREECQYQDRIAELEREQKIADQQIETLVNETHALERERDKKLTAFLDMTEQRDDALHKLAAAREALSARDRLHPAPLQTEYAIRAAEAALADDAPADCGCPTMGSGECRAPTGPPLPGCLVRGGKTHFHEFADDAPAEHSTTWVEPAEALNVAVEEAREEGMRTALRALPLEMGQKAWASPKLCADWLANNLDRVRELGKEK